MASNSGKFRTAILNLEFEYKLLFRLTVVDTPGFGDGLEGSDAWQVVTHSSQKFNQFNKIPDKKLDFIEPLKIIK